MARTNTTEVRGENAKHQENYPHSKVQKRCFHLLILKTINYLQSFAILR